METAREGRAEWRGEEAPGMISRSDENDLSFGSSPSTITPPVRSWPDRGQEA